MLTDTVTAQKVYIRAIFVRNYQKVMHNLVMLPRITYSGCVGVYVPCRRAYDCIVYRYKHVTDCVKVDITL